jgi:hypothetical protein
VAENISITSANARMTLTVRNAVGIVVGPFTVEGYAQDAAFATEPVDAAEALMGVDGKMAAGYLPRITRHTFSLMANSPSIELFEAWDMHSACSATFSLPTACWRPRRFVARTRA